METTNIIITLITFSSINNITLEALLISDADWLVLRDSLLITGLVLAYLNARCAFGKKKREMWYDVPEEKKPQPKFTILKKIDEKKNKKNH